MSNNEPQPEDPRGVVLGWLADRILAIQRTHPIRVAVDGIDAAGKSIFGDELAGELTARGAPVIRSTIDAFHYPRQRRHSRYGGDSPVGYFEDSFDYSQVRKLLLEPLGPGGNRVYRTAAFDFQTDTPIGEAEQTAPKDAILVFDGIFLLRDELMDCWDYKIFLEIPFELSVERASQRLRDQKLFGPAEQVAERYRKRYVPGQQIYFERCQPKERADVVIDNTDLKHPRVIKGLNLSSSV